MLCRNLFLRNILLYCLINVYMRGHPTTRAFLRVVNISYLWKLLCILFTAFASLFILMWKPVAILLHKDQVKQKGFPFGSLCLFPEQSAKVVPAKVQAISHSRVLYHTAV